MTDTQQLLAELQISGSDAAFRELVRRYVDLVYSTANLREAAPILDEVIDQLVPRRSCGDPLRRFFEQLDFRAVGEAMGSSEEAARKRVNRTLEKLEVLLRRRGVVLSAVALGAALQTQAIIAAPAPAIHCQNELRQELDAGFS